MPQMHTIASPLRLSVAKNTIAQLLGRVVGSLSTLAITLYIARMLGASGYGDFVKVTTFVSFFYLLADFGLNAQYIAKSTSEHTDSSWLELAIIRTVLSSLLILLALSIVFFLPRNASDGYSDIVRFGIIILLPTILFQAVTTTSNGLFQKLLRYEWSTIAVVVGSGISLLAVWFVFYYVSSPTLMIGLIPLILGSAATAIVGIWFDTCVVQRTAVSRSIQTYRSFIISSVPLGLTLLFNVVYFHIDSVVLTLTRSTQEVGVYGLAYKVFELALVFPTFFMNALYPIMVGKRHDDLKSLLVRSVIFLLISSIVLSICLWAAAPLLVLIRHEFALSIPALRILLIGLPLFFVSSLMMWSLIVLKKQTTLVYIYGISMLLNIVFNIMFVPTFGYIAAAWITVASEGLVLIASGAVVYKNI